MLITKENVWKTLQAIYDSEINVAIATFWDWGYWYSLDNTQAPLEVKYNDVIWTNTRDIAIAVGMIVDHILNEYSHSTFAKSFQKETN